MTDFVKPAPGVFVEWSHGAIAIAAALLVGLLFSAGGALATHKHTASLWHHGIGDFGDADAFVHPFLAEVDGTYRESFVAYGYWGFQPYWHSEPEHRETDSHNHLNIYTGAVRERDTFASVRSPVTGLAHHHHTCGNGDCYVASGSGEE